MILIVILWILWTILLVVTVSESQDNGITRNFVTYLLGTITLFAFSVFITIVAFKGIQFDGAQKYLDKEIVIEKFEVQYDPQNQPIDTTYTFKYVE